jgi:hypothetical protein
MNGNAQVRVQAMVEDFLMFCDDSMVSEAHQRMFQELSQDRGAR